MITEVEVNKNLIIEYKAKHKLTVREFIAQSGISMTIYYKIFLKPHKIGMRHAIKLAKFMKVNLSELLSQNKENFFKELETKNNIENFLINKNLSKMEFCNKYQISIYLLEKLLNKNYFTIRTNNIYEILKILNKIS